MKRQVPQEALRFLISGGINTAVTYLLYLALLPGLGYWPAYSVAFVTGIVTSYFLNTRFVFRVRTSARRAAAFPLVYLAQYLFGLAVLHVSVRWLAVPAEYAALISIALSVPFTFALSRFVLAPRAGAPPPR